MFPATPAAGLLTDITRDGLPVPFVVRIVKGVPWATLPAVPATYHATYARP